VLLAPVRWIVFSLIQASWLIIPAQLLHSITVVSLMVIGITYVDRQLPPRWRATGQGLYTAAVFGIGPSIWQFVAGPVYENFGVRAVWLASLGITVVGVLILGLALRKTDASAQ
jgi:PPP family 3-phenylpropionic acid transporter